MMSRRLMIATIALCFGVASCGNSGGNAGRGDEEVTSGTASTTTSERPTTSTTDKQTTSTTAASTTTSEALDDVRSAANGVPCEPIPASATSFVVSPSWATGQLHHYDVLKSAESGASSLDRVAGVTPARRQVVGNDDEGWQFFWETEPTTLVDFTGIPGARAQTEEVLAKLPNQRTLYRIDEYGSLLGVDNMEEIRRSLTEILVVFGEAAPTETAAANSALERYINMPDDELAEVVTAEVQLLHYFEGLELELSEVIEFDDYITNAFGGEPFPAVSTVSVLDPVDADGCLVIEKRTEPDQEQLINILWETLAHAFPNAETVEDVPDGLRSMTVEYVLLAQYDTGSGLVRSVTESMAVKTDSGEQAQTTKVAERVDD